MDQLDEISGEARALVAEERVEGGWAGRGAEDLGAKSRGGGNHGSGGGGGRGLGGKVGFRSWGGFGWGGLWDSGASGTAQPALERQAVSAGQSVIRAAFAYLRGSNRRPSSSVSSSHAPADSRSARRLHDGGLCRR